jgi:membrane-bound lytic murein transglycosylase B
MGVTNYDGSDLPDTEMIAGIVADTKEIAKRDLYQPHRTTEESDTDIAPAPVITAYLTYPNFYRIKKWNNSSWYAIAIAELAEKLK